MNNNDDNNDNMVTVAEAQFYAAEVTWSTLNKMAEKLIPMSDSFDTLPPNYARVAHTIMHQVAKTLVDYTKATRDTQVKIKELGAPLCLNGLTENEMAAHIRNLMAGELA